MALPLRTAHVVHFGEFELDLSTRELGRNGTRQVLAPQPFQLLEILIQNEGRLVTREALVRQLWPDNTFVDYEQGLKKAVNRLREVLQDSADDPRYIETLPRQGYRFIADVVRDDAVLAFPQASHGPIEVPPRAHFSDVPGIANVRRKWLAYVAGVVGLLAMMGIATHLLTAAPSLPRITESRALTNDGLPKSSLVADQQRLYFVERINGKSVIRQMSMHGGEASTLETVLSEPFLFDFSAARSELLVGGAGQRKHRELWAVSIPGGNARRIGDLLVHEASWSHGGNHIAYAADDAVFIANADGTASRKIATVAGVPFDPRFAPADDRIRFVVTDPVRGSLSIWEVRSDGSQLHQLQLNTDQAAHGLWSADGRLYFFNTWQLNPRLGKDLWVTSDSKGADAGQASVRLTNGPLVFSDLAFSSDGKTLFTMGTQARFELIRYDPQTKAYEPFLNGISATDVALSRDGEWAAYVSYPDLRLWRSRIDGSDRRQLTFGDEEVFQPQWSPDGSQILFTSLHRQCVIFSISRDGGTPRPLIPEDRKNQIDPTWSPDGKSVVFARSHIDPDLAIYRFDLVSRTMTKLPGSENLTAPRLSPDGRHVFALSRDWSRGMLYDTVTSTWTELLNAASGGFGYASWSKDSQWLYLRQSGFKVIRVRVSDGHVDPVVDLSSMPDASPSWSGLGPDNSILTFRDRSLHEIYAMSLQIPQ